MIIVEGPDNSGKSTLIRQLVERFPTLEVLKSPGPNANYNSWMEVLTRNPEDLARVVCDRFLFSEYVYGPMKRGRISLDLQQHEVIWDMVRVADPLVIRCHLIRSKDLFRNREQLFDWDTALEAEDRYDEVISDRFNPLHYTFGESALGPVMDAVYEHLCTRNKWINSRRALRHGRGEKDTPQWMIVGQNLAKDNRWKVPFERSKSARMLHRAIRSAVEDGLMLGFGDIWFTNAIKNGEPMTPQNLSMMQAEALMVNPENTLALGNKAAGVLGVCGIDHLVVYHPAWYLRRGGRNAQDQFVERFKKAIQGEGT